MPTDFSQRIVMITGAAGNLGVAVAQAFRQAGAQLILVDHTPARLPTLYPELAATTTHMFAPATDVADAESVAAMMAEVARHYEHIDVLVNTVGAYRAGTPLHATPLAEADFLFGLNARSVFVMCQAVIPVMLRQGSGKIINTASRAALNVDTNQAAYSASKMAVVRLTESMAGELKNAGINVNCILPGLIDTPPNRAAMPDADFSRWVAPAAIADVILFLASEQARAINGAAIPVYGRS